MAILTVTILTKVTHKFLKMTIMADHDTRKVKEVKARNCLLTKKVAKNLVKSSVRY